MINYVRLEGGVPVEHIRLEESAPAPDGWLLLIRAPRPADTATTTFDRAFTVGSSAVQETWVERTMTAEEQQQADRLLHSTEIDSKVDAAITANIAWLNRPGAPNNQQVLGHIDRLTRQVNGLLRETFRRLDSTNGA